MTFSIAPSVVVVAGPNGAGKTTAAPFLLRDSFGYSGVRQTRTPLPRGYLRWRPSPLQLQHGGVMLARIDDLARQRISFGLETTLASPGVCEEDSASPRS